MQAGEPLASDGPIMIATARIGIVRFVFAKAAQSSESPLVVMAAAHTRLSLTGRISSTKADRKRDHNTNNQIHIR
jgi:hypothetical protein